MTAVRRAKLAGSWYEGVPAALGRSIDRFVGAVDKTPYAVRGAVLPHAGHTFSGNGIARAFANLPAGIDHVMILAPSHYALLPAGRIGYGDFDKLATPLGDITGITGLFNGEPFSAMDRAIEAEHSAEMFLPFIKRLLPDADAAILLVPRIGDEPTLRRFADAITAATAPLDPLRTLIIASSDFTHYGDRFGHTPFGTRDLDGVLDRVAAMDRKYARYLATHGYEKLFADREREDPSICGLDPALVLSRLMELRGLTGETAGYYTSCDLLGKSADFVCYATILFHD